jgi:hypothetical protein
MYSWDTFVVSQEKTEYCGWDGGMRLGAGQCICKFRLMDARGNWNCVFPKKAPFRIEVLDAAGPEEGGS